MNTILVTGSAGLIGSEAVGFYAQTCKKIIGIDNNLRSYFFGKDGDVSWNIKSLVGQFTNYEHHNFDILDRTKITEIFKQHGKNIELIIHCAAQPSHDWAAKEPLTDFGINAFGTLIMLECFRNYAPEATFIFTSTNKVYGDTPNLLPFEERETRFEIKQNHKYFNGINETMSIDQSKHSVFGASKVAADIMCQEYGRYFGLKTGIFRGGCLTGSNHSAAQLHGFLAYLVKCVKYGHQYKIFGYKGKQVRDNIHAVDLINAFDNFYQNPRKGEVYNIGGSRVSSISILEAISEVEQITSKKANIEYIDQNRSGDHMWYISDVSKFKNHYPNWKYQYNMSAILNDLCKNIRN